MAAPAETLAAAEIAEAIADAVAQRAGLRITGAGTWLDAGAAVRTTRTISLEKFTGITEYVPGDLVLTALAGTSMREIASVTGSNGQWLPLDPFGVQDGTLGATVATASAGPLAHANGGPRDLVLGVECVAGTGKVIRGGGRVTKNVAGFDLTRLLVGSWGTLGVITEISVRLRARPAAEATIAMTMPMALDALSERLQSVRLAPLEAMAMELLDRRLATTLGFQDAPVLLVRLGGNEDGVAAQRATLGRLGPIEETGSDLWDRLRSIEPNGAWVWRMSDLPSRVARTWEHAEAITRAAGSAWIHASIGRGIVRCICPQETIRGFDDEAREGAPPADPRAGEAPLLIALTSSPFRGTIIYERLPADAWARLSPGDSADVVSRRIRSAFDPHSVLNPGILAEAPA